MAKAFSSGFSAAFVHFVPVVQLDASYIRIVQLRASYVPLVRLKAKTG